MEYISWNILANRICLVYNLNKLSSVLKLLPFPAMPLFLPLYEIKFLGWFEEKLRSLSFILYLCAHIFCLTNVPRYK